MNNIHPLYTVEQAHFSNLPPYSYNISQFQRDLTPSIHMQLFNYSYSSSRKLSNLIQVPWQKFQYLQQERNF